MSRRDFKSKRGWPARSAAAAAALLALAAPPAGADDGKGWGYYGGTSGGTRYSAARQIDRTNVADLEVAWTYSTGELQRRGPAMITNSSTQTTPILVDGSLVFCTPFNRIVALDPATGRERWVHDAEVAPDHAIPYSYNCRGVSQWRDPRAPGGAVCATRIFMGTVDSRVVAVDSRTGRRCPDFGTNGEVRIARPTDKWKGESAIYSAPVVAAGVVAVGSFIMDNLRTDAPPGTVHAFDARTGAPQWQFDPIPRDPADPAFSTWLDGSALKTGAANVWSTMVADEARGIIYAPVGSASPDFYGGMRKGDNLYSSSLVALDATTGRRIWHFQIVRHDVWDYDVSAPPLLAELPRDGAAVPAVVQNTKQGFVFVFDRTNGRPLFPIEDRPVPQGGALPGEQLSKTQPFPVKPAPLVPIGPVTPDDAWGFTPWDRAQCRKEIAKYRSEGLYTPPSAGAGTLLTPGSAGGANWGGAAYDPSRRTMYVNVNRVVQVVRMIPRAEIPGVEGISLANGKDVAAGTGTPYGTNRTWLLSPWGAPCTAPPWGELVAVDLVDGEVKWRVPLGSIEKRLPLQIEWNLGTPNLGGPIVTAGGLVFIGATMDQVFRAFDAETGEMLWRHELPAGTHATPMTYEANGRQYVVLVTGHHLWFGAPAGDTIYAFALPDGSKN
jgi:quinoprotein glucose dehydrogenase